MCLLRSRSRSLPSFSLEDCSSASAVSRASSIFSATSRLSSYCFLFPANRNSGSAVRCFLAPAHSGGVLILQHWIAAAEAAALPTLAVVLAIASGNKDRETSCDLKWLSKDFREWYDRLLSRDLSNDLLKFHWDSCCMALAAEELATAWICLSPGLIGRKLTDK